MTITTDLYSTTEFVRARRLTHDNVDEILDWMHEKIKESNRAYSHGELLLPDADERIRKVADQSDITPRYVVVNSFGQVALAHADQFEATHSRIDLFEARGSSAIADPPVFLNHLTEELKKAYLVD